MWTCHFSLLLNPCPPVALERDNLHSISQKTINSQCFSGAIRCLCCLDWHHQRGDSGSRYWLAVGVDASQTTQPSKISSSACFPSTVLPRFFGPSCWGMWMSSSASVLPGSTPAPRSVTRVGRRAIWAPTTAVWAGMDIWLCLRMCIGRWMYSHPAC